MAVRVGDILQLDVLKWAHTLAGVRGIVREVQCIDVLETPDTIQIMKPNVLLLTSGYAIQDNEQLQKNIIRQIHEVNAAGLAIQIGKYFTLVPETMIHLADELQVPIIELPAQVVFADIISESLRLIFLHQGAMLRQSQEIHYRLAEVVLAGGDLTNIAQNLAELVRNTVIICDRDFQLMAYAYWSEDSKKTKKRRVYQGRMLEQFLDNLEKTGLIEKNKERQKGLSCRSFI